MGHSTEPIQALANALSSAERDRAGRFTLKRDADNFIVRHTVLRALLGFYLHEQPGSIPLDIAASGNPSLPPESRIKFNMSYAGDMAVFAISQRCAVGVDIERVHPIDQASSIMESFFTFEERWALRNVSPDLQMEAFYKCWSRKEALLKATGDNLSRTVNSVSVLPILDEGPRSVTGVGEKGMTKWTILTLPPIPGYTAALATEGDSSTISTWLAGDIGGILGAYTKGPLPRGGFGGPRPR
jgi:4'-phosphopantetheinyl transferase